MTKTSNKDLAKTLKGYLKGRYKPSDDETIRLYVEADELCEKLKAKLEVKLTASATTEFVKTVRFKLALLKSLGLTHEQRIESDDEESDDELDRF